MKTVGESWKRSRYIDAICWRRDRDFFSREDARGRADRTEGYAGFGTGSPRGAASQFLRNSESEEDFCDICVRV